MVEKHKKLDIIYLGDELMKIIVRKKYLDQLIRFKNNGMVKIVTGVRRCGKSSLFEMFRQYLLQEGIEPSHLIEIDFEKYENKELTSQDKIMEHLQKHIVGTNRYYIFIDEVQELEESMKTLNYIRTSFNADLYVTGSNSSLFSSEFSTYLAGRYVQIKMYPLNFQEFIDFTADDSKNIDKKYDDFVRYGGFPQVVLATDPKQKIALLNDILDSVLKRDVMLRGKMTNDINLLKVTRFLFDNIGSQTSISGIKNTLVSNGATLALATVEQYVDLLTKAYLIYPAHRYDIKGKEHLKTNGKYYVVDTGIRNALLGYKDFNIGKVLENIVFQELIGRNLDVTVGKIDQKEIDFVTSSFDAFAYFQVADIFSESKRELENFALIPDNYPKILVTNESKHIRKNIDGIGIVYITDFLLETRSN